MTILENLMLKNYKEPQFSDYYLLNYRAIRAQAQEWVEDYHVSLAGLDQPYSSLIWWKSAKITFSSSATDPRVMVIAYPAQGLDIERLRRFIEFYWSCTNRGTAILILSEDLEEILKLLIE